MRAYIGNGLRARACNGDVLGSNASTETYDDVVAGCMPFSGTAFAVTPGNFDADRPHGLGLTSNNNYTLIFDGEIQLPLGGSTISLLADDQALAEIAADGVTFGSAVRITAAGNTASLDVTTTAAGFYPVHFLLGQGNGSSHLIVTQMQGGTSLTPVYRYEVTSEPGIAEVEYGAGYVIRARPNRQPFVSSQLIGGTFGTASPATDVDDNPPTSYVLRYVGQVLADAAGTYTFHPTSDGPSSFERVWIDGVLVAETVAIAPFTQTSATIPLTPGWHDVLVDAQSSRRPRTTRPSG